MVNSVRIDRVYFDTNIWVQVTLGDLKDFIRRADQAGIPDGACLTPGEGRDCRTYVEKVTEDPHYPRKAVIDVTAPKP